MPAEDVVDLFDQIQCGTQVRFLVRLTVQSHIVADGESVGPQIAAGRHARGRQAGETPGGRCFLTALPLANERPAG